MPQVGDRLRILVTHDHIHLGPTLKASATCRINCCTSPGATRDLGQVPGFLENPVAARLLPPCATCSSISGRWRAR